MGSRGIHASILLHFRHLFFLLQNPLCVYHFLIPFLLHIPNSSRLQLYTIRIFFFLFCTASVLVFCSTNVLYILQYKLLFYNLYTFKQVDTMPTPLSLWCATSFLVSAIITKR